MSARENPGSRRGARRTARAAAQDRAAQRAHEAAAVQVVTDARVYCAGPFWVVAPDSRASIRWLRRNLSGEQTWLRNELVVEGRFVVDLVEAMRGAGLVVEAT